MARFSRIETTLKMEETGMVPVFYHSDIEVCKKTLEAAYKGGIRVFEFTNRGDRAHHIFSELIQFAEEHFPEMAMGAGTVFDAGTASIYMQEGADFVVSPVVKEDMAKACNRRKVLWSPGTGTLTEISQAEELGAEVVKVFPGSTLGPKFIKAALAPMPWSKLMVTGGVTPERENLQAWFEAGVVCVGMGSKLFRKDWIADGAFGKLEETIKEAMQTIQDIRSS